MLTNPQENKGLIIKPTEILRKRIANTYPETYKARLNTLFTVIRSGLRNQRITVTYLGRKLKSLSKTNK